MKRHGIYEIQEERLKQKDLQIYGLKQLVSSLVDKIECLEASLHSYEQFVKGLRDTINLLNRKLYGSKSEKHHSGGTEEGLHNEKQSSELTLPDKEKPVCKNKPEKPRKPYKRPERRTYDDIEERVEVLEPDSEELKGAKFVRSEKTFRLYMIHLPIHRQMKMFKNAGAEIARSTLYDWCGVAIDALEGVYHTIKEEVLKGDYLNIDETTVSVIDEDVHHVKKEYMWGLVDTKNKLTFFTYGDGSRSKNIISNILEGYIGTIQTDGYSAYRSIGEDEGNKIKRLSCLCHIRRKFIESRDSNPGLSDFALSLIDKIYRLEKFFRKMKFIPDKIRDYRIRFTVPIFRKFKEWLDNNIANPDIPEKSLIGKAVSYAYREFHALTRLFDDGFFKADNNAAERAMRPCKLGMNNYLFFGNHASARRGAIIYTVVESCKLNNVNVFEYLTDLFSREPKFGETYEDFLPNRWGNHK